MKNNLAVKFRYLEDRWDDSIAATLDEPELLRYRSNLLGSDLRITNFGGGNTSSKTSEKDPLDGSEQKVLWVKGSGGDLGSIRRSGFATLYMGKLLALAGKYRGVEFEDEMVDLYPLCAFGRNNVASSIDTPLHGYLPFAHVDHLHPDWGIALAAAANGHEKLAEFNERFKHHLIWLPWQRPGFELGMMLQEAVNTNPEGDGVVLGGHGLFTWGGTQRECYLNTITIIDQLGQFVLEHVEKMGDERFGGSQVDTRADHKDLALAIFPYLRGRVSAQRRLIGTFAASPEVQRFVNSKDAKKLASLGTSCPDHFIRTKIRPLYVPWNPEGDADTLREKLDEALDSYRREYVSYYEQHAKPGSPAMRDPSPAVVLIPGVGMFSFGKSKTESRITGEFYVNAIHVMEGASSLQSASSPDVLPQASPAVDTSLFQEHRNYVALPPSEAFRIEYWALEEAKIRRQAPEKELSRYIVFVVGGGSGIGREVVRISSERGAHVIAADRDLEGAKRSIGESIPAAGRESTFATTIDITSRPAIQQAIRETIAQFGGIDILINTAALFPSSPDGRISDEQWALTLDVNVTANHLLVDEVAKIFADESLNTSIVLTSSANAVVAKRGSEVYDISKAAVSHLIRELAVGLSPKVRVNGISPATVVKGSTMFPRDRVCASLTKYNIAFDASATDEELRTLLAQFYAKRTLTGQPIDPVDCANAILFLAGPQARCTSGHLIPVDGGLVEAFLR